MAGLSLSMGARGSVGSYTPLTPASAQSPSGSGMSIGNAAYGISGSGVPNTGSMVGISAVTAGVVALFLLGWIYYSLPR